MKPKLESDAELAEQATPNKSSSDDGESERLRAELDRLAYVISHDFKAPLRGIHSVSDWLRQDYGDSLDQAGLEMLDLLQRRVLRLATMVDALLTFSRIERREHQVREVDLHALLQQLASEDSRAPHLDLVVPETLPVIHGAPERVQFLFAEILDNAIAHSGRPRVRVEVQSVSDATHHLLQLTDDGKGLSPKRAKKAFDLYHSGRPIEDAEHVGMGLPLCRKIVGLHGGIMGIQSAEQEGLTVWIRWPAAVAQENNQPTEGS